MAGLRRHASPPERLPFSFTVDDRTLVVSARPSKWWIRVLAAEPPGCWFHVVPMSLDGQGVEYLTGRLLDESDSLDLDDVEALAEDVIGAVMGMDMWAAHRLMRLAYSNWLAFDAWCVGKGFDPASAHPGRVAAGVYSWRLSACEKKNDVSKLDADIFAPPPLRLASGRFRDQAPRGWDDATEGAAFMQAMQNLNG